MRVHYLDGMVDAALRDAAYREAVDARIANLWAVRQLYRKNPHWSPKRHRVEIELRLLVSLARQARRDAREARNRVAERMDPITLHKAESEHGRYA